MIDSYFLYTMDKVKSEPSEAFQSEEFHCPVEATLSLIGGKYKTLILWNLIGTTLFRTASADSVGNAKNADSAASRAGRCQTAHQKGLCRRSSES